MTRSHSQIKTMKLYTHVDRVERELGARGFGLDDPLSIETLFDLDQLHYHGPAAVRAAIDRLGLVEGDRVIDVGSGLGGPARLLAAEGGCRVTAIELQPDLNQLAADLTRRTGLEEQIEHHCADFLTIEQPGQHFDALVSWLTFLHIPDRAALLERCFGCLRPGGSILVEDFYARPGLGPEHRAMLENEVYCRALPSWERYRDQIETAGFERIEMEDMSAAWGRFVRDRLDEFLERKAQYVAIHGHDAFQALAHFYAVMVELFQSDGLGGLRWCARRPDATPT